LANLEEESKDLEERGDVDNGLWIALMAWEEDSIETKKEDSAVASLV
jgi:hypothetical protein